MQAPEDRTGMLRGTDSTLLLAKLAVKPYRPGNQDPYPPAHVGAPTGWTTEFVGPSGDARGTSQAGFSTTGSRAITSTPSPPGTTERACGPMSRTRRLPGHGQMAAGFLRYRSPGVPGAVAVRGLPGELRQQRHLERNNGALDVCPPPARSQVSLALPPNAGFVRAIGSFLPVVPGVAFVMAPSGKKVRRCTASGFPLWLSLC